MPNFSFLAGLDVAEKFGVGGVGGVGGVRWVSFMWLLCLTPMLVALELL